MTTSGPLTVGGHGSLNLLNPLLLRHWTRDRRVWRAIIHVHVDERLTRATEEDKLFRGFGGRPIDLNKSLLHEI